MKEACDSYFGNVLHHAYCIEGTHDSLAFLEKYVRELLGQQAHILTQSFALFAVDDGRTISKSAMIRATKETPHVEIIYADSFSVEAQNVLLKAIEEPSAHTHYLFVTPRLDKILPTILSRSISFSLVGITMNDSETLEIKEFLSGGRTSRMTIIARYLKEAEGGESEAGRRAMDSFFERLIIYVSVSDSAMKEQTLEIVMNGRKYIRDKGSSQKMIAEYVALMIPEHFK